MATTAHPVMETNLQRGVDIALNRVIEREKRYPLGRFSHYTILYVLRAANEALRLNLEVAEAHFADADPGERSSRDLHDEFAGLAQLTLHPRHIVREYTKVEEAAVLQLLAAVHLVLFDSLPECELPGADLSHTHGCQRCRASMGASYGVLRMIGQAARDGVLDPAYRPLNPDQVHELLLRGDSIFGKAYRRELDKGRTPLNLRAGAWLRYNGTVPPALWPRIDVPLPQPAAFA